MWSTSITSIRKRVFLFQCVFSCHCFFSSSSYKKFHAERDGSIEACTPHLRLNMLNK